MIFEKLLKSQGLVSTITIALLISSYIFTILYNISAGSTGEISAVAKTFLYLTIIFLFLFLIGFIIFILSLLRIKDVKEIFLNPGKISVMVAILLLCSYLSTVMHNYASNIFGALASMAQIFFYLSLVFIVFFIVTFIAMLVSFSNKFLYSKKL